MCSKHVLCILNMFYVFYTCSIYAVLLNAPDYTGGNHFFCTDYHIHKNYVLCDFALLLNLTKFKLFFSLSLYCLRGHSVYRSKHTLHILISILITILNTSPILYSLYSMIHIPNDNKSTNMSNISKHTL